MKICHSAVVTPHQAGLYETARDLVEAERRLGLDAWITDPTKRAEGADRGVPIQPDREDADVLVSHSGLSQGMRETGKPVVHVMHGRPYSSFLLEQAGQIAVYTFLRTVARDDRYKAFVTFWAEFLPYFSVVLPNGKLYAVPPPVNLERWTPDGPSGYSFHGQGGKVNVVVTDIWRRDKDPFHVVNAFILFARKVEGAKLHVYAAPQKGAAWDIFKKMLEETGTAGEIVGFVKGLDNVYRAADMMITPHRMATRSVREALACGCQVVMAPGNDYTPYQADPEDIESFARMMLLAYHEKGRKAENREVAEVEFNPENTAREFVKVLEKVIHGSR